MVGVLKGGAGAGYEDAPDAGEVEGADGVEELCDLQIC